MFFGRKRRRAVQHVTDALRPLIAVAQISIGIPPGFWEDDYVLGFTYFMISFHAQERGLSQIDKGRMLAEVYTNLSNMNGVAIAKHATLLCMDSKKTDFHRGADNAAVLAFFIFGNLKDADQYPEVRKAREMAEREGKANDHTTIGAILTTLLYTNHIEDRFNGRP